MRTFVVTLEPATEAAGASPAPAASAAPAAAVGGTPVHSTFAGSVEVVDLLVKQGDQVSVGTVVAAVEAMKAKHDIKSPVAGRVTAIHVKIGDEIDSSNPIMTIA
jgi:biotin carboxyl carrier protein